MQRYLFLFLLTIVSLSLPLSTNAAITGGGVDEFYVGTDVLPGAQDDFVLSAEYDTDGNLYVLGNFEQSIDLDPRSSQDTFSTDGEVGMFLSKYDSQGNYLFSRVITGNGQVIGYALDIGPDGNVYIIGSFTDTADFDPGPGEDLRTNIGANYSFEPRDIFIAKWSSQGEVIWTHTIGEPDEEEFGYDIAVDSSGNAYVVALINGPVDLDPGPGEAFFDSAPAGDGVLVKYASDGSYQWAKIVTNGIVSGDVYSVAISPAGQIIVAGKNQESLGGFNGFKQLTYVAAYHPAGGNVLWQHQIVTNYEERFHISVATDADSNVYLAGTFTGTVDFDPGAGTDERIGEGLFSMFLSKYDSSGSYQWTKTFDNNDADRIRGLTVTQRGDILLVGEYRGVMDFNPNTGTDIITSTALNTIAKADAFMTSLGSDGSYNWTRTTEGEISEYAHSAAVHDTGDIALLVNFNTPTDFDPGTGDDIFTNQSGFDAAIVRFSNWGDLVNDGPEDPPETDSAAMILEHELERRSVYVGGEEYFIVSAFCEYGDDILNCSGTTPVNNFYFDGSDLVTSLETARQIGLIERASAYDFAAISDKLEKLQQLERVEKKMRQLEADVDDAAEKVGKAVDVVAAKQSATELFDVYLEMIDVQIEYQQTLIALEIGDSDLLVALQETKTTTLTRKTQFLEQVKNVDGLKFTTELLASLLPTGVAYLQKMFIFDPLEQANEDMNTEYDTAVTEYKRALANFYGNNEKVETYNDADLIIRNLESAETHRENYFLLREKLVKNMREIIGILMIRTGRDGIASILTLGATGVKEIIQPAYDAMKTQNWELDITYANAETALLLSCDRSLKLHDSAISTLELAGQSTIEQRTNWTVCTQDARDTAVTVYTNVVDYLEGSYVTKVSSVINYLYPYFDVKYLGFFWESPIEAYVTDASGAKLGLVEGVFVNEFGSGAYFEDEEAFIVFFDALPEEPKVTVTGTGDGTYNLYILGQSDTDEAPNQLTTKDVPVKTDEVHVYELTQLENGSVKEADVTFYNETGEAVARITIEGSFTDTTPPVTQYDLRSPWVSGLTFVTGGSVVLSAADPEGGVGVATTKYKLDDDPWESYNAPVSFDEVGEYTLYYKSVDHFGNEEAEKSVTLTVVSAKQQLQEVLNWAETGEQPKKVIQMLTNANKEQFWLSDNTLTEEGYDPVRDLLDNAVKFIAKNGEELPDALVKLKEILASHEM